MIGRFGMGKEVGTPSMKRQSAKSAKAKYGEGAYSKATVAKKFSKIQKQSKEK